MDVLCYVVAVMHSTATSLDTGPVGDIASSIVRLGIGCAVLELQTMRESATGGFKSGDN